MFTVRAHDGHQLAQRATRNDAQRVALSIAAGHQQPLEVVAPDGETVARVDWRPDTTGEITAPPDWR